MYTHPPAISILRVLSKRVNRSHAVHGSLLRWLLCRLHLPGSGNLWARGQAGGGLVGLALVTAVTIRNMAVAVMMAMRSSE
jgi:hypothetical protein